MKPTLAQVLSYFRLSLVTGLVDLPALVAWADRELVRHDGAPPHALIELSLAGSQPLSQVVGSLYEFQSFRDAVPLRMLLARADLLLEQGASPVALTRELRLLLAENLIPADLKRKLQQLEIAREQFNRSALTESELRAALEEFLAPYREAREWLPEQSG